MNIHDEIESTKHLKENSYEKSEPIKTLANVDDNKIATKPYGSSVYIGPHIRLEEKSISYYFIKCFLCVCCCGGCRSKKNSKKEK